MREVNIPPAPRNGGSPDLLRDIAPVLSRKFLDIQTTIECRFTLKDVRDMILTYNQLSFGKKL